MQGITLSKPVVSPFGEKYFREVNQYSFEKVSSDALFNTHYSHLTDHDEYLYIVIGTDSGLFYQFVQQFEHNENVKFIFVDFDEVIQVAELAGDQKEVWKGDYRLVNQDFNFNRITQDFRNYVIRQKITLIKSLSVMDAAAGSPYFELWEKFEVAFSDFRRTEFNALSTKVFEEERILNAADNIIPASNIINTLGGKDVLILGGGPTLDDSIEWIKENQDKLIIVAAARIAKRMARESIIPDFFVTVDPFDWSFDNSKSVLAFSDDSILLHSFHAQHKIVSQWRGLSAFSGQRYGWKVAETQNIGMAGPTVTNAAVHIACSLGATRVYFSGIDFCFARGLSHESGSEEVKVSDVYGYKSKARVVDNEGNITESSDDFYSAYQSMQEAVILYQKTRPSLEIYSLGLHSAKLEGVPYISCDDVQLQDGDKFELMLSIREKLTVSSAEKREHALETVSFLKEQKDRFIKIKKLSTEGLDVSAKLYDKKTESPKVKAMTRVQRLRKKTSSLVGDDGEMLMNYQATLFADSFKPIADENAMEKSEIEEQLLSYFGGLDKLSDRFIKVIDEGLDRAQLRADELDQNSLPSQLYELWESNNEFGRAVQWQSWHQNTSLSKFEDNRLAEALEKFQDEYEKQEHWYSGRLKSKVSNVATLISRAHIAYDEKNLAELEGLITHSEGLPAEKESQKESFLNYLKGLRAELTGNLEEAIDYYLLVEMKFFRHQAFKKLLNIYMSDKLYQESLVVLEQLCAFSIDYMVPYAELMALLGNAAVAADVLELFLTNKPDNISVKNKLIKLLIDSKQFDKASLAIEQVLESDPINKTALFYKQQLVSV